MGLYALDVYATAKIDQLLLEYYGPELYDRYTNLYEPPGLRLTATTENDYYGYRSLHGLQVLSWLDQAFKAYEATQEILEKPNCLKRISCELKSRPEDDKTWLASKLEKLILNDNNNGIFTLGQAEKCRDLYPNCHKLTRYEKMKN